MATRQQSFQLLPAQSAQSCSRVARNAGANARTILLTSPSGVFGPFLDFLIGAGPWLLAVGVAAASLTAIVENTEGTEDWLKENLVNDSALAALGSMLSFLVVTRIGANLSQNAGVVGTFGSLCGATVGLSLNVRGLATNVASLESCRSRLALAIASLPHAVFYKASGAALEAQVHEEHFASGHVLPICDDRDGAFVDFKRLRDSTSLPIFETLVLQIADYIYQLERSGNISPPKVGVLMQQLNSVAGLEGNLSGTLAFTPPRVIDGALYVLFVLYYLMLLVSDLVPNLGYSAIWVAMVVTLSTAGLYGISARLKNPFKERGGGQNQRRGVRASVLATEKQVVGAMNSAKLSGLF